VWQSTIFIVVGLVSSFILRHRSARAHQVLFLAMIAAVIVPIMSILVKHYELGMFVAEPVVIQSPAEDVGRVGNFGAPGIISAEDIEHKPGAIEEILPSAMAGSEIAKFPLHSIVLYGWIAASLILATRLLLTFALGVRLLGRALPLDCQRIEEALNLARAKLGIDKDVMVRSSRSVRSPVIWCWRRRPVLLVPSAAGRFDNGVDWAGVLCHELAHWKRRDHISGLFAELAVCILPWHPLVWWAKSRLVRLSEQVCDDWVVASGQPGTDYAESLLDLTPGGQMAFVPAVVRSKRGLAGRVRRILKDHCGNPRTGTKWALATSLATLCLTVGVALAQTRPAEQVSTEAQDKPPAKSLHEAAKEGDVEEVKRLIAEGANVNATEGKSAWTPLLSAATEGHAEVVRVLLANGAKVNMGDSYGYTPLYYAIWSNDEETVRTLVSGGADVKKHPPDERDYYTPLVYAIWEDHTGIVKTLLDAGADLHAKDEDGFTPLYWAAVSSGKDVFDLILAKGDYEDTIYLAACRGQLERVKTLIEAGTDVNAKDEFGCTPLQWAVLADSPAVAEFLVAKGADVNVQDKNGFAPISVAPGQNTIQLLISQGADVNVKNTMNGATRLHNECAIGNTTTVECLLAAGADVNAKTKRGTTPLHRAALLGHQDTVKLLIERGANINASDNQGRTPLSVARQRKHAEVFNILRQHGATETLHGAVTSGDIDEVKRLISEGAGINAKNMNGETPLHIASAQGREPIVKLLITEGADLNAQNQNGEIPLHLAASRGDKDMAALLIANSADINTKNRWGNTPLHIAAKDGYTDVAKFLLAKGADVNAKNKWSATPLHIAARNGQKEVGEFLIASGADVNAKNQGGRTPLTFAEENGNNEIAELLRKHGAKE